MRQLLKVRDVNALRTWFPGAVSTEECCSACITFDIEEQKLSHLMACHSMSTQEVTLTAEGNCSWLF